jgi:hypothetical protein
MVHSNFPFAGDMVSMPKPVYTPPAVDIGVSEVSQHLPSLELLGCRLVVTLWFKDEFGYERPMYPCVRSACACAGVFYKDYGGKECVLVVRVGIEYAQQERNRAASSLTWHMDASRMPALVASDVSAYFARTRPIVTICTCRFAASIQRQLGQRVDNACTCHFYKDKTLVGGGIWEIVCRPSETTPDGTYSRVDVQVGPNAALTSLFEVRTKATEWILLQHLPEQTSESSLRVLLTRMGVSEPSTVVIQRTEHDTRLVAVIRYGNRALAGKAYTSIKRHYLRARPELLRAKTPAAAMDCVLSVPMAAVELPAPRDAMKTAGGTGRDFSTLPARWHIPTPSLITNLSRMYYYNPLLPNVRVPDFTVTRTTQRCCINMRAQRVVIPVLPPAWSFWFAQLRQQGIKVTAPATTTPVTSWTPVAGTGSRLTSHAGHVKRRKRSADGTGQCTVPETTMSGSECALSETLLATEVVLPVDVKGASGCYGIFDGHARTPTHNNNQETMHESSVDALRMDAQVPCTPDEWNEHDQAFQLCTLAPSLNDTSIVSVDSGLLDDALLDDDALFASFLHSGFAQ